MNAENNTFNQRKTFDMNAQKRHQKELGYGIPENYFSSSKNTILNKTVLQKESKVVPLYKNIYAWSAAAAVALLLTLTVFNTQNTTQDFVEDDVLLASLLTEDDNVDTFVEDFLNDELLTDDIFVE